MKRRPKKRKQLTGAPDPVFLKHGLNPNGDGVMPMLKRSSSERARLRQLPTKEIAQQVQTGILELTDRVFRPKHGRSGLLDHSAAKELARMATFAASILEELAFHDSADVSRQIEFAGVAKNRWPVNLRLGRKKGVKGPTLLGGDKARTYLEKIRLGEQPESALKSIGRDVKIFRLTAELVLQGLIDIKVGAVLPMTRTAWFRNLLALESPMTKANRQQWWKAAKQWMDEQWVKNPGLFIPLIKACEVNEQPLETAGVFESEQRSRVIDLRLKEAFFSLARTEDL